ncbi:MAG: DUF1579 domain-containing protein [Acidobacteria bacterium]|nr:DUF1579 domain-containing protein [Acidobacteriota bacterium]MBI3663268.1 DUF1579 domain-containing protein [Acidobacteriota bacterium]
MFVRRAFAACLMGALTLGVVSLAAQEKKAAPEKRAAAKQQPMDEKAMMEMMQKLATPGPGHKKLDVLVGAWQAKTTMWMDPAAPPAVSEGTSTHKWVLGGRFLEQSFDGTFMGKPFSGLGYTAYDNYKKKYISTWMDTLGTMIMITTGSFDPAGKVLTSTGKIDDFTTGKVATIREKMTIVSSNEILFEMWGPAPDGKDYRMMEIRYTRKK